MYRFGPFFFKSHYVVPTSFQTKSHRALEYATRSVAAKKCTSTAAAADDIIYPCEFQVEGGSRVVSA